RYDIVHRYSYECFGGSRGMRFIAVRLRSRDDVREPVASANTSLSRRQSARCFGYIAASILLCAVAGAASAAPKSANSDDVAERAGQKGAIDHAQKMRKFPDVDNGTQSTPPVIPESKTDLDPTGAIGTYQPSGATQTSANAFFQDLGTNQRTCLT